jgi:glycerophosphoryl diester phosphodiesterase
VPSPLIVAHRGDREHYPENTLAAFESALVKGADALELDVFSTRDGELVVHHDYTLERTVAGTGYVGDYMLAELRRLSAGAWFGPAFDDERIPTLAEVLDLGRGRVRFELELRTPSRPFLERLLRELERHGVEDEVELTSPHLPLLGAVRAMNPVLRTGMFVAPFPAWLPPGVGQRHVCDYLTLLGAQVAHLPVSLLEPAFIADLQGQGRLVHAADLNTEGEIARALEGGVDQLSTDHLELALRVRGSR